MVRPVAVIFAAAISVAASCAAMAGAPLPHWTGAGWYHMKQGYTLEEYWIHAGPFPTERVCKATLPVKPPERFCCEYFATRPPWDF
jgi:hypothetical protein